MTVLAKSLATGTGSGSASVVYTAPTATTTVIKAATFCNTTAGALTVTVYANDGTDRMLMNAQSLAAGSAYRATELTNLTLDTGEDLKINAAIGIDYWVSGIEIV